MTDGTVVTFNTSRGFGFIRARGLREDLFVHIGDVAGGLPLRAGQKVRFEVEPSVKGPRAVHVEPGRRGVPPWLAAGLGLALVVGLLSYGFVYLGLGVIGAGFAALNVATWFIYGWDKHLAGLDKRRIPEVALLGLALAGGSPGAALGMWAFRHKTRKRSFLTAFAAVLLIQAVAAYAWYRRGG